MTKDKNISLFAVSFKQGFISPKIPIATFYQEGKKLNFLLDSGSDKNVLDNKILSEITYEPVEGINASLTGVGGVTQVDTCRVKFNCDNEEYTEDFLVTDLAEAFGLIEQDHCITLHGIIGATFMRKNNIVMDFQNLVAYSKNKAE
jgi:hypothetical protein